MTICVKSLIIAAGGDFQPGMKLKAYWWELCESLLVHTDTRIEPRTLEVAWREGKISRRVKDALEKLVQQKAKHNDFQLIGEVEAWINWFDTSDPWVPKADIAACRAVLPLLHRLALVRSRIAVLRRSIEIAQAADDEEKGMGSESAE